VHNRLGVSFSIQIRADESMKAQAMVKDRGRHTFIDKVKVRLAPP
jgi:hypothetical protein